MFQRVDAEIKRTCGDIGGSGGSGDGGAGDAMRNDECRQRPHRAAWGSDRRARRHSK